jgi:hypothetical protein
MTRLPKTSPDRAGVIGLVAVSGERPVDRETQAAPRPPGHLSLRRAAELVEGAAYDLAGRESPVFISRLIEIAAELERHSRSRPQEPGTLGFRAD